MASLDSVRQKLVHAKVHFESFKAALQGYFGTNPCAMVRDADSTLENPTFSFFTRNPIPTTVGLIAGDCLQNMRSALDYLVWELVLAENHQPSERNMFPICATAKSFKDALRAARLQGVGSAAFAEIESLQPYQSGEQGAPGHPLAVLDYLVNVNKHRRVLLTLMRSAPAKGMIFGNDANTLYAIPALSTFDPDADFGNALTPAEVEMHGGLIVFVTLQDGPAVGTEISIVLLALADYISSEIIPRFERFFV